MPRIGDIGQSLLKLTMVVFLLSSAYVQAAVYYVDQNNPAANDSNPGTERAPWQSLYPAGTVTLSPGDIVLVKAGTYHVRKDKGKPVTMINPVSSGEVGKPILFKSSPALAATLEGEQDLPALIQIVNQGHIAIEGFRIVNPGETGLLIKGDATKPVAGISIRNNVITQIQDQAHYKLQDAIHIENATQPIIDNNRILCADKATRATESTAIRIGNVSRALIEYNEIENLAYGIRIQKNATGAEIGKNIISNAVEAIQVYSEMDSQIIELKIANNVFVSPEVAISMQPEGGLIRKTAVSNNVFTGYIVAAMQIEQPGMGKIEVCNNVFKSGIREKSFIADVLTYDDPPLAIVRMDYNLFSKQPLFITGLYSSNRRLAGLDAWHQFANQDLHSVVAAVEFRNSASNDFRLAKASRHSIKGRVDGQSSSARVEVGAYTSAITQIGITRFDTSVKSVTRQAKASTNKHEPRNLAINQSTVSEKSVTAALAPVTEKLNAENTQHAAATEGSEVQSFLNAKHDRLEWQVEHSLQFAGKCVLESNKIDFYDGYDNTGLKFRVVNNELYLLTKSNIDMSFHDVGLEVGKNPLLHADNVVLDQDVVFSKELPKLVTQLRQSADIRVQLRFWPNYPATRTYSKLVAFNGFLSAYDEYKNCQHGE